MQLRLTLATCAMLALAACTSAPATESASSDAAMPPAAAATTTPPMMARDLQGRCREAVRRPGRDAGDHRTGARRRRREDRTPARARHDGHDGFPRRPLERAHQRRQRDRQRRLRLNQGAVDCPVEEDPCKRGLTGLQEFDRRLQEAGQHHRFGRRTTRALRASACVRRRPPPAGSRASARDPQVPRAACSAASAPCLRAHRRGPCAVPRVRDAPHRPRASTPCSRPAVSGFRSPGSSSTSTSSSLRTRSVRCACNSGWVNRRSRAATCHA